MEQCNPLEARRKSRFLAYSRATNRDFKDRAPHEGPAGEQRAAAFQARAEKLKATAVELSAFADALIKSPMPISRADALAWRRYTRFLRDQAKLFSRVKQRLEVAA